MTELLSQRWQEIWLKLHAETVPRDGFDELVKAYSSPERFYHNLTHVDDCLSSLDQTRFLASHPEEVELAIWFHDAVYDTRRNDNEQKSVEWAASVIYQSRLPHAIAKRVSNSILATRHTVEVTDTDAQLMVDIDLSILGRDEKTFSKYEENIRKEYIWVPESLYRLKRIEILHGFLDRQHLYYHEIYWELLEEKARANLKRAISRLASDF